MRVTFASLLSIAVAAINLVNPAYPGWDRIRLAANALLLVTAVYMLWRGTGRRREDDIGAPHLLSLRSQAEQQSAELHAMETKVRHLESELALARRKEAEAQLRKPSGLAEAQVIGLVGLLQSKGRLLDFLMDDITGHSDADVGAAARVVHQGCREVMRDYFDIAQVSRDEEGANVTLEKDFDPKRYRLLGRVGGQPPFRGTLLHRGWMTTRVKLPRLAMGNEAHPESEVIAPAEIELN